MKRNRQRKRVIALLIMLSFILSTGTFAYWASFVEGTTEESISTLSIGSGDVVETVATVSPNQISASGKLVPIGQKDNSIGLVTDQVDFYYQLFWNEKQEVTQVNGANIFGDIETSITFDIVPNGETFPLDKEEYQEVYDLVNIFEYEDNPNTIELNSFVPEGFGFSVTLDEPETVKNYELISESTIYFFYRFYINTSIFDLDLNLVEMDMDDLLAINAVSPNMNQWKIDTDEPLSDQGYGGERNIFFPITKDEYTLTINAKLDNIDSLRNGYGIHFDTFFDGGTFKEDNGYCFQFDRGYANGEMIIRPRVMGYEKHPFFRETSYYNNYFPSKYEDPSWWVDTHEFKIEVSNLDAETRQAKIYLDGVHIGTATYDDVLRDQQQYVGFRVWGGDYTDFYSLTVE